MSAFQGFSNAFGVSAVGDTRAPGTANSTDRGAFVAFDDPRVKLITAISITWSDVTIAANLKPFKNGRLVIVSDFLTPADNVQIDAACFQPQKLVSTLNQRGDGQIVFDHTVASGVPFFSLNLPRAQEYIQSRITFIASPALFTDTTSGYFVQPNITVFGEYGEIEANTFGSVWYPLGKPNPALQKV